MTTDLKAGARIKGGDRRRGEAEVVNGRLRVKVVSRGTVREGIGESKLKGGIASHLEVTITNGFVRIST